MARESTRNYSFDLDIYLLEKDQDFEEDSAPYKFFTNTVVIPKKEWGDYRRTARSMYEIKTAGYSSIRLPSGAHYRQTTRRFQMNVDGYMRNKDSLSNCVYPDKP